MDSIPAIEEIAETSRLLSELDFAIDQLCVVREIVTCYERVHKLECMTGPSRQSRKMRKEIEIMETRLRRQRDARYQDLKLATGSA